MLSIDSEWSVIRLIEKELKHSKVGRGDDRVSKLNTVKEFAQNIQNNMNKINTIEYCSGKEVDAGIRVKIYNDVTSLCIEVKTLFEVVFDFKQER